MTLARLRAEFERLTVRVVRPGLARTRWLLRALGRPDLACPAVQITGTNGKGSVAALVSTALAAAGTRVGRYTSPHLGKDLERIWIAGRDLTPAAYARAVRRLLPGLRTLRRRGRPATAFEAWTVLAAEAFRQAGVELAVLEVGMGGRLDATTAWGRVILSVLTNVGLEHTRELGATEAAICREKLGLARPGIPILSAVRQPELRRQVRTLARRLGCPVAFAGGPGAGVRVRAWERTPQGIRLDLDLGGHDLNGLRVGLRGAHQVPNAALAALVLDRLGKAGFPVPDAALRRGFSRVHWPGRLELARLRPQVFLDGAHNPPAARAVARELLAQNAAKVELVMGVMADKDVGSILRALAPVVARVWTVTPPDARGLPARDLAERWREQGHFARAETGLGPALASALRTAGPHGRVLVTGSLYIIGPARKALRRLARSQPAGG
jgi:dihydrofolate synthase / folylpolyglutamate synthase